MRGIKKQNFVFSPNMGEHGPANKPVQGLRFPTIQERLSKQVALELI